MNYIRKGYTEERQDLTRRRVYVKIEVMIVEKNKDIYKQTNCNNKSIVPY